MISQPIATVEPGCILIATKQRFLRAGINRDIRSAEFDRVERVPRGLVDVDIAGDGRDRDHSNIRGAKSHDDRNGIVGSCVGIDQEGALHWLSF